MQPIATDVARSVICVSVCVLVTRMHSTQELIRRWDSERELFNDDIAHT